MVKNGTDHRLDYALHQFQIHPESPKERQRWRVREVWHKHLATFGGWRYCEIVENGQGNEIGCGYDSWCLRQLPRQAIHEPAKRAQRPGD